MDIKSLFTWLAPMASTLIVCAGQLWLNQRFKRSDEKRETERAAADAERKERTEWRARVEKRLDEQDKSIKAVLEAQCTEMRSDITHKVHRYMDDLQSASTEEKQSLWSEYEVYCAICAEHGIKNHFVEQMVRQVMDLPDRSIHGDATANAS